MGIKRITAKYKMIVPKTVKLHKNELDNELDKRIRQRIVTTPDKRIVTTINCLIMQYKLNLLNLPDFRTKVYLKNKLVNPDNYSNILIIII
jgi:formylmethanofuran:tetrahydromethanopterin formyltransferase